MKRIDEIIELVASIVQKSPAELRGSLETAGLWDSFNRVEIVFAIEDKFGKTLTPEQVAEMRTISDIVRLIGDET